LDGAPMRDKHRSRKEDRKAKCRRWVGRSAFEEIHDLDSAFENSSHRCNKGADRL
jgi:hypothetical protein